MRTALLALTTLAVLIGTATPATSGEICGIKLGDDFKLLDCNRTVLVRAKAYCPTTPHDLSLSGTVLRKRDGRGNGYQVVTSRAKQRDNTVRLRLQLTFPCRNGRYQVRWVSDEGHYGALDSYEVFRLRGCA